MNLAWMILECLLITKIKMANASAVGGTHNSGVSYSMQLLDINVSKRQKASSGSGLTNNFQL